MRKLIVCVLAIVVVVESIVIANFLIEKRNYKTDLSQRMVALLLPVKTNIDDCVFNKGAVDVPYITARCELFISAMNDYEMYIDKKANGYDLCVFIQNYKKLLSNINANGYTDEYEKGLLRFKKIFEKIDINYDKQSIKDFRHILERYNASVEK